MPYSNMRKAWVIGAHLAALPRATFYQNRGPFLNGLRALKRAEGSQLLQGSNNADSEFAIL